VALSGLAIHRARQYVDIRFVDVHRVAAYLSHYLTGDKVSQTLELLPKRARIFTTSRSIVLWGKKKTSGWWLRRMGIEAFYDAAPNPANVHFEPVEDLKPFGLELLSYFESPAFARRPRKSGRNHRSAASTTHMEG